MMPNIKDDITYITLNAPKSNRKSNGIINIFRENMIIIMISIISRTCSFCLKCFAISIYV